MIKQILLVTFIYAVLTVSITMTLSREKLFIPLLIILNIVFALLIIVMIYKNFRLSKQNNFSNKNQLPGNQIGSNNSNFDSKAICKISQKPFLLGLEKGLVSSQDFYYDQDFFYSAAETGEVSKYRLTDIIELSGTGTQINNSRIWQVTIANGPEVVEYRFAHNFSIWNKNFLHFYHRVKQLRPEAIKSEWSFWRM